MAADQCVLGTYRRRGEDVALKFKVNSRMGERGDLNKAELSAPGGLSLEYFTLWICCDFHLHGLHRVVSKRQNIMRVVLVFAWCKMSC